MNAKIVATIALGAFSAIPLGVASFYYHSAQETKAVLARLSKESAALDLRIQRANERITAANQDSAALQSILPTEPSRQVSAPTASLMSLLGTKGLQAMVQPDPRLFAVAVKNYRSLAGKKYRSFFHALNLTPDQIDKFESLATQHGEALADIVYTASQQGLSANDPAIAVLMQQENDQFTTAQQALLGDAVYQQMLQFDRLVPVSGIANDLAIAIALTSTPLSGSQADQLTQVLANASSSFQKGGKATLATINWPAALAQAQGILSPAQFEVLQDEHVQSQVSELQTQFINQEIAQRTP